MAVLDSVHPKGAMQVLIDIFSRMTLTDLAGYQVKMAAA
jgi:hypothetical protein